MMDKVTKIILSQIKSLTQFDLLIYVDRDTKLVDEIQKKYGPLVIFAAKIVAKKMDLSHITVDSLLEGIRVNRKEFYQILYSGRGRAWLSKNLTEVKEFMQT